MLVKASHRCLSVVFLAPLVDAVPTRNYRISHRCLIDCARVLQDLENYILDLRRQLQEAADDRATLVGVQRQTKSDLSKTTEDLEEARRTIAQKDRELAAASTQLKVRYANLVASPLDKIIGQRVW